MLERSGRALDTRPVGRVSGPLVAAGRRSPKEPRDLLERRRLDSATRFALWPQRDELLAAEVEAVDILPVHHGPPRAHHLARELVLVLMQVHLDNGGLLEANHAGLVLGPASRGRSAQRPRTSANGCIVLR